MIPVELSADETGALRRFMAEHPRPYTEAQACRLLIRDMLIGMGILALPRENRSRWAGRRR